MVAGNSAAMPGQLPAWHSLYLAHPAEQFTSMHKQDLVIYDCPLPLPHFLFLAARVWIGRDKTNGWRGACDGAQSVCYLCLFSVTAFGLRKANITIGLTQYVRQREGRGGGNGSERRHHAKNERGHIDCM